MEPVVITGSMKPLMRAIEFLDKDNYTFTGTSSKFQGSMTEYIDVEVDGETYYAVYADKNGKSLSYVRDTDGFWFLQVLL